jgi:hypothetical protein
MYREATPPSTAVSAAAYYGAWPLHRQTTFEAVTHSLLRTTLTDAEGRDLGTALQLVQRIDRVAGQETGVRGDQQFRLYVDLRPGAAEVVRTSREFFRDKDNTVFHKGYPVNYRLGGRFPSIQISITPDGDRADIDVDYLSSRVPQGLFNGHLSSPNSDVRARHARPAVGHDARGHLGAPHPAPGRRHHAGAALGCGPPHRPASLRPRLYTGDGGRC